MQAEWHVAMGHCEVVLPSSPVAYGPSLLCFLSNHLPIPVQKEIFMTIKTPVWIWEPPGGLGCYCSWEGTPQDMLLPQRPPHSPVANMTGPGLSWLKAPSPVKGPPLPKQPALPSCLVWFG